MMNDLDKLSVISKKLGRVTSQSRTPQLGKIAFYANNQNLITEIFFEGCNLLDETIPSELWELSHLEKLYLNDNQLLNFPLQLIKLKKLRILNLKNLEDGRCSFSNNLSENAIRPFTVGRKNWLFCDSPDGAQASADVYTMVEIAKANGVNVYHYLTYLLEKCPNDSMSDEEFEQLAPWNEEVKAEIKRRATNLKK